MNQAGTGRGFVGFIRYSATFFAPEHTRAWLRLPRVSDAAHVRLNDADMGWILGNSGQLELTGLTPNRLNTLRIEVPTTLVWRMKDPVSAFMALQPTGLGATPELIYEAPDERSDTP